VKLSNYIFVCFFLTTILMLASKGSYSAASYNPVEDEVVIYQENVPSHVYVHESVHKRMWVGAWLLFICAMGTLFGFAIGTTYTKWPFLFYVALSMYMEVTAYILTPMILSEKVMYISLITIFAIINLWFWRYLFYETDIGKPIRESDLRDAIYPILIPWAFWII
jgi:hypothetical protein